MTVLDWFMVALEMAILLWAIRLVWKAEREEPTESIIPATDRDVELVE
ncbi:MAG: hypothetical protein OXI69_06305 [Acidobacteriota bacterium]|nr:hypothetical protein [Acidobacteriota bacterium]